MTSNPTAAHGTASPDVDEREHLAHTLEHWGHLLPSQGPMTTFVHHNTLHGLQHKPFEVAVAEGERLLGGRAYEPVELGRERYRAGRITDTDIDTAFAERPDLGEDEVIGTVNGQTVTDRTILRLHLLHGLDALQPTALRWVLGVGGATETCQSHVSAAARDRLLSTAQVELAASLRRVGAGWTMSDMLEALLNVSLNDAIRNEVAAGLEAAAETSARRSTDALMRRLGIPKSRHEGYLVSVQAHCRGLAGAERSSTHELWLMAEARALHLVAGRHFGVPGTLDAVEAHLSGDLERYGLTALWYACLASFDVADPIHPSDIGGLSQRADTPSAGRFEVDPGLLNEIRGFAQTELDRLEGLVAADPDAAARSELRESAHAAVFILREIEDSTLSLLGVDALEFLQRHSSDPPAGGALLEQVCRLDPRSRLDTYIADVVAAEIDSLGAQRTHADIVQALSGEDIVSGVNQHMIRIAGAFLDLGQAAWHMPDRPLGFFDAWRRGTQHDNSLDVEQFAGWRTRLSALPPRPDDAVIALLNELGVRPQDWNDYVGRVLVGLPGWAGMMNWRGTNEQYPRQAAQPGDLVQYLAVRLFIEVCYVRDRVWAIWGIQSVELKQYLASSGCEVWARREHIAGRLPDFLADRVRGLTLSHCANSDVWKTIALEIWAWQQVERGVSAPTAAHDQPWRLFRLAQLQGWSAGDIRALPDSLRDRLISLLDAFPADKHGPVWLTAFEGHYREEILGALAANRGRGRWRTRDKRPKAQIVLCIDEREESMHRAIDELDPEYESFGSGGFFGVAMDYSGLDDHGITPLCPANQTPATRVIERGRPGYDAQATRRAGWQRWEEVFHNAYWESKRNAVSALFLIHLFGLVHAVPLFLRVLSPWHYTEFAVKIRRHLLPQPLTDLSLDADGSTDHLKPVGFAVLEQADRVEAQLRNIGMTYNFSRLVVFCGHGSVSVNNPHESAHDCGACGGKHGGPNGRAFAALANRPAVRAELARRGIEIPDDTHFVGGIHNTASDLNMVFDTVDVPATHQAEWTKLHADMNEAAARSARERCRRFASAPKEASAERSLRHVVGRTRDLSQVRPEWGHCTNAFAIVGRRSLTQGAFFDRRGFVISYDPTQDPTGTIVERIILSLGPVGAGINLEYYFSSVDKDVWGCGTKVPHNVSGLMAVMGGAASDLRTGLPKQMTEIHEPMRLLFIIESPTAVLGAIYGRQPVVQELLDNAWVQLVSIDPTDGSASRFVTGVGFVPWEEHISDLPQVQTSFDYYRGQTDFLAPALLALS